jgi:hypothetical protein
VSEQSWEQFTQSLAARLPRLSDGDTIILFAKPFYAQLQQGPDWIQVEAASNNSLPPDRRLSGDQEQRLRDLGWQDPNPPLEANFHVRDGWPLSGRDATRLSAMIVTALRDVFGIEDAGQVEEKAFNAFS